MKTPIEQLIVKLEDLRDLIGDDDTMYRGGVVNAIRLAEGMLEKEKNVITNAYWEGCCPWNSEDNAEDYYNRTFKNK